MLDENELNVVSVGGMMVFRSRMEVVNTWLKQKCARGRQYGPHAGNVSNQMPRRNGSAAICGGSEMALSAIENGNMAKRHDMSAASKRDIEK